MTKMIRTGESMTAEQLEQFCKNHPDNKTEESAARETPTTDEPVEKPKKERE